MVRQNKQGFYYFFVRYKDPQGIIRSKKIQSETWIGRAGKKAAEEAERDFLESLRDGPYQDDRLTVNGLYELYKETKAGTMKQKSLYTLDNAYQLHIKPYLGSMRISSITNQDITRWQRAIQAKGYRNKYLSKIQEYLRGKGNSREIKINSRNKSA